MCILARAAIVVFALGSSACIASSSAPEATEPGARRPSDSFVAGDGEARRGLVEPRALIVTAADGHGQATSLGVYDRTGRKLAELLSADLEREAAVTAFTAERALALRMPASAGLQSRRVLLAEGDLEGMPAPTTSSIVLLTSRGADGPQRVVGREPSGQQRFDLTLDPRWTALSPSPSGRYVFADDGASQGAVFEAATGRTLWQGALEAGTFTAADDAFIHVEPHGAHDVVIQPLPGGTPQVVAQPAALTTVAEPGAVHGLESSFLAPELVTPHGVIFAVRGAVTFGTFLFVLADGQFRALGGPLGRFADERLGALEDDGAVVTFMRSFPQGPRRGQAPTSLAYDLRTGERTVRQTPRPRDAEALRERVAPFLGRSHDRDHWERGARWVDAGGRRLIVGSLAWTLNRSPDQYPDPGYVVLREDGTPLALLPVGEGRIDRTGTMLLHEAWSEGTAQKKVSIVDLRDGARVTFEQVVATAIVYGETKIR